MKKNIVIITIAIVAIMTMTLCPDHAIALTEEEHVAHWGGKSDFSVHDLKLMLSMTKRGSNENLEPAISKVKHLKLEGIALVHHEITAGEGKLSVYSFLIQDETVYGSNYLDRQWVMIPDDSYLTPLKRPLPGKGNIVTVAVVTTHPTRWTRFSKGGEILIPEPEKYAYGLSFRVDPYRALTPLEKEYADVIKAWEETTPRSLQMHVLRDGDTVLSCQLFLRKTNYGSFVATFEAVIKRTNGKVEPFVAPATKATLFRAISRARYVLLARVGGMPNYQ